MLNIEKLKVSIGDKTIIKGLDLQVNPGEVHAIMGPNGAGKSTLGYALAGRPGYDVEGGQVRFKEEDLLSLDPEERSRLGLFLGFQYPVEISGVSNLYFLKAAKNAILKANQQEPLDAIDFLKLVKSKAKLMGLSEEFLHRGVNEQFSGGEKKRNEILQLMMLEPQLAILDETDSGLDIDALQVVADGVNRLRNDQRSFVLITHYQRLLDFIEPDYVHVLSDGKIVKTGDAQLAKELEQKGYGWLKEKV